MSGKIRQTAVSGMLLAPPPVQMDAVLAWVLASAFSDVSSVTQLPKPEPALRLARQLELSGRIAHRLRVVATPHPEVSTLESELIADLHNNLAVEALLGQALQRFAVIAEHMGVPTIAVKYAGLRLASVIAPGSRVVGDLDLLVPVECARSVWHKLLDAGYRRTQARAYAHQLEALVDPYGAVVEIHLHLPGVLIEDGQPATADHLIRASQVERSSDGLYFPKPALLAAHAIAHSLQQNRATPQSYSALRMLSDLADLRVVLTDVILRAADYLPPETRSACQALDCLCDSLTNGRFAGPDFEGTSAQLMLWHCIAARTDSAYSARLRAAGLENKLRGSAYEIAIYILGLICPSDAELDALYGVAVGPYARLSRRLRRPFELTGRAARRWARSR